jgi:hypothetical protein
VRSRALLLFALAAGLVLASGVAAAADAGERPLSTSRVAATRDNVADVPTTGAVTRVHDPIERQGDARRADVATLTAALLLAAGAASWVLRSRHVAHTVARHDLVARPRGPPDLPAIVSI